MQNPSGVDIPHPVSQNQWINSLIERHWDLSLSYMDIKVTPLSLKKNKHCEKGGGGGGVFSINLVGCGPSEGHPEDETDLDHCQEVTQSELMPVSFWFRPECCSGSMFIFCECSDLLNYSIFCHFWIWNEKLILQDRLQDQHHNDQSELWLKLLGINPIPHDTRPACCPAVTHQSGQETSTFWWFLLLSQPRRNWFLSPNQASCFGSKHPGILRYSEFFFFLECWSKV